ncbi:MAG: phosphoethanolamine--lipid A transferase [Proteobacteria bacterium]|nr:phosphoethanolamine--lipid A transferase [Pseudomonadota bacterium]
MNSDVRSLPGSARGAWLKPLSAILALRPQIGVESLILCFSLYFTACHNAAFWRAAVEHPLDDWRWALSLAMLATAANALLLGLLVWRWSARPLLTVVVLASALAAYFMGRYGVHIDADMVRNVLHTDAAESRELLSWHLLVPLVTALPPLVVLWRVRLRQRSPQRALAVRLGFLLAVALVGAAGALASAQDLSAMVRNHREIRYLVTPANFIVSLAKVASEAPPGTRRTLAPIGEDAHQLPAATGRKPRLLVLVVGETARAQNWGLDGYARQTTPELARLDVLNYPRVRACGSSTEVSLPCMFSPQGRRHYDERAIRSQQSLLHVLARAGVSVAWRDNQSGCKGVCDGLPIERLESAADPAFCGDNRCLDGILLRDPAQWIGDGHGDRIVVLHMLGNHGPNYFERYPPAFERYTPVCRTGDLGDCSRQQIVNAYDNALLYTDHVLGSTIRLLQAQTRYDAALLYVSDHGESLGEKGLYLHGMPYAFAPAEQLDVPMALWLSPGLASNARIDRACMARGSSAAIDHDHLFHSVLGLFDVRTALRDDALDLFAACRPAAAGA